jgi:hypothetical protein
MILMDQIHKKTYLCMESVLVTLSIFYFKAVENIN